MRYRLLLGRILLWLVHLHLTKYCRCSVQWWLGSRRYNHRSSGHRMLYLLRLGRVLLWLVSLRLTKYCRCNAQWWLGCCRYNHRN